MKNFHIEFFNEDNMNNDELNTIFLMANQHANDLLQHPVLQNYPPEEAKIMALSFAIAIEIIDRYDNMPDQ